MRKMKVGLIGVGDISNKYVDNLKQYPDIVEIKGCAARNYEKTCGRAKTLGIDFVYPSVDALLADPEIDIVLNLTTPDAHAKYNLQLLRRASMFIPKSHWPQRLPRASRLWISPEKKG